MVEKRDRSTSEPAQTRRTSQTFDASQAGDRRLSATHFEDGYDAFPVGTPPWLGEHAHQNSVIQQCGSLRSPIRCVTLRSTSISNAVLWLVFANHHDSKISQNRASRIRRGSACEKLMVSVSRCIARFRTQCRRGRNYDCYSTRRSAMSLA
jgi:hypothetical protein